MAKHDKKMPMTVNEEIEESLLLLHTAKNLGDTLWVDELIGKLTELVETRTFLSKQKKKMSTDGYYD
ncbi:hypothetical protein M3_0216 [Lysinibacillus phage vB_LfM_LysYB1]|nr:hypothetical protein M3_0216 [Lysinibacillus phage vB_LfM_LysYB1]WAB25272.1 hypothetical protein M5_0094 [Lysinibacillus phage vB_LfM_LysYB2]